jgi:hypothetical protein
LEPRIARSIVTLPGIEIMRFAVKFDDQASRMTCEVGDEGTHRDLTSKTEALDVMGL